MEVLAFALVLLQFSVELKVLVVVAEMARDGGDGVVDGDVGEVLGEVGEDHKVRDAGEGGHEVGGEFLVELGCAGLEHDEDIVCAGDGETGFGFVGCGSVGRMVDAGCGVAALVLRSGFRLVMGSLVGLGVQVGGRCRMRTIWRLVGEEGVAEEEDGDEDEGENGDAREGEDSRGRRRGGHDDGEEAFAQEEEKVKERESPSCYERDGRRVNECDGNMGSFEGKLTTE